jgi:hypothetical protein
MKHSIGQFTIGLALSLISLASQGLAQSTPQQVKTSSWQLLTTASPAVASDGTNRYIAWMGLNNKVYFAVFNGTSWIDHQIVGGSGWTAETSAAPALAYVSGTAVWLAWKGVSGNDIWYSIWNGTSWSTQQTVSGSGWAAGTNSPPALVNFFGTVYVMWEGDGSTSSIWYSYYSGGAWSAQETVSGSGWTAETNAAPSVITDALGDSYLLLFWKGKSGDSIWGTFGYISSSFNPSWTTQGTESECSPSTNAGPAAVSFLNSGGSGDDLAIFWKDSASNTISYSYASFSSGCGTVSGSGWSAATNVAPAVATYSDGTVATGSILAWKNASNDTVWFLDPTTLPGISTFAH